MSVKCYLCNTNKENNNTKKLRIMTTKQFFKAYNLAIESELKHFNIFTIDGSAEPIMLQYDRPEDEDGMIVIYDTDNSIMAMIDPATITKVTAAGYINE